MSLTDALRLLEPGIGHEIYRSDWIEMTQERVDRFAGATGDHQWIHVDPERAAHESPYGKTIAHGFFVLGLYPSFRGHAGGDEPPLPGVTRMINYGLNRVRFPHPVGADDRIRGVFRLLSATDRKGALEGIEEYTVEIDGADKPGCVAEVVRLMFFD